MKIRYDPDAQGLECVLGPLEAAIMQVLWSEKWKYPTNRRIHRELMRRGHDIGLSAIATTTKRMTKKGLLIETEPHNVYNYTPIAPEDDFIDCVVERILGSLIVTYPEHLESYLGRIVPTENLRDKAQGATK